MLEKIKKGFMGRKTTLSITSPELGSVLAQSGYSGIYPGQPVYPEMTMSRAVREGYALSIAVYRCIRVIVEAASGIPWQVVDKKTGEVVTDDPFILALAANPVFSQQDIFEFKFAHENLCGNAIWQPIYIKGEPREFWPIMPDTVQPVPADENTPPGQWLKEWLVTDAKGHQDHKSIFADPPNDKLPRYIHFMKIDPGNPYWGKGPLQVARKTILTSNDIIDTQKVTFQNRGTKGIMMSPKQPIDSGDPEKIRDATQKVLDTWYSNPNNVGRIRFFPNPMDASELTSRLVDLDLTVGQWALIRHIASSFGIDSWWLNDKENATYNNSSEAQRALYETKINAELEDTNHTFNMFYRLVWGNNGREVRYDISNVTAYREARDQKFELALKLFSSGMSWEDLNQRFNLGLREFDGWGKHYLPLGILETGSAPEPTPAKSIQFKMALKTEEQKKAYWQRGDKKREAWAKAVSQKIQPLYTAEGKAVAAAIEAGGNRDAVMSKVKSVINTHAKKYEPVLKAVAVSTITEFGGMIAADLGGNQKASWIYTPMSPRARKWVEEHIGESIGSIAESNLKDAIKAIDAGFDAGKTTPEIARDLKQYYDESESWKAYRTARTEVATASGYGQHDAAIQAGMNTKGWLSSRDDRVRETHQPPLDGEKQPISEPYSNGLMYPGDTSTGNAGEFINCRCDQEFYRE